MKKAGWPIRFRLDPMIPFPNWKKGYGETIRRINALSPEMVTLGSLRATSYNGLRNASKANGRDESIFDYLTEEKDPSGFKYRLPFEKQVEMFRFAMNHLKMSIKPALCKEDRALWKALGLRFDGCHCLLGRNDSVVKERHAEMKQPKPASRIIGLGKPLPILA
jgi:spore photoproduct lyase